MTNTKKLTISALSMAMYIVLMYFTQSFSFGQYQVRIATSLYALNAIYPFLIIPMATANMLSNMLMGGMGPFDILGGFAVGFIISLVIYLIKRLGLNHFFILIPIILIPAMVVPIWLTFIIGVPYKVLAFSIGIGQIIPALIGVILVKRLERKI